MNQVVSHWSANPAVFAVAAMVVAAHLLGMRAIATGAGREGVGMPAGARREAVAFYFGVLVVVLALVSPVGYWAQRHIWVRSLQDLLVGEAGPALIVLGAPWSALARGLRLGRLAGRGAAAGRGGDGATASSPSPALDPAWRSWPKRRRDWMSWPLAVTVAVNAAWWVLHLPVLYDAVLRSVWADAAEIAIYLALGVALWLQLIGSRPFTPRFPPLRRAILVAGTVVSETVLAMALAFGSGLLYPGYLGADHGLSHAMADQQVGGGVLWVLSLPAFVITAVALLNRWLKEEESEALAAGLERLLEPPASAWPSRPGLR